MLWFNKKNSVCPIGLDMGDDVLKLIQLEEKENGLFIVGGGSGQRPEGVAAGSGIWQRWAIDVVREQTSNGRFKGRDIVAAIPAGDVFIDHMKMPKVKQGSVEESILSKIKQRLTFEPSSALIKYIPTENDNIMVIATERGKIDRYLAIFENANLRIKSIVVWPAAIANSYSRFFGRRRIDAETVVMLIDMDTALTNVVVCRHRNLLFARSIVIGTKQLSNNEKMAQLVLELNSCRRQVVSMYEKSRIERLIFLSGSVVEKEICVKIAKQLEMPAQIGDCMAAVDSENGNLLNINRRECQFSWATAFGLSLS